MTKKTKLELTWPGKDERPKLEPRILIEDPSKSYHAQVRREGDIFDNMLIKGDNLLALKALEQDYAGKVKCIFIDPPYNTGSAFTHYDDGVEHSIWLSLMRDRLEIIRNLLSDDGSLWITIDDNESHYLKILCDEIFGRENFVSNIVWQSKDTPGNNASTIAQTHNMVLVFKKSAIWRPYLIPRSEKQVANYKNPDNDPRGAWLGTPLTRAEFRERDYYALTNDAGRDVWPPKGSSWRRPPAELTKLQSEKRIYWGKDGDADFPVEKKFLSEVKDGVVPQTWWPYDFAGSTRNASAELKGIFEGEKSFDTPKPEKIVQRALEVATRPGDIVLDSFAGSGTTGAVAHKMGRRWIMVEIGDHATTHIMPRLVKVVDGIDQGGVSKIVDWKGGGGFRYFTLAPSLLEQDKYGNWVIAKDYNPAMLAEAMCKHMGFTYAPAEDPQEYWRHGHSTETDFIYVTTQALTHDACAKIAHDVGPDRSLLICCKAFDTRADAFDNLTLVKIPTSILQKCEWGRDDYSLNIQNLPMAEEDGEPTEDEAPKKGRRGGKAKPDAMDLFGGEAGDE
ncbi:adenine specific DNA methylase [Novosphingobium nitrogenifigens DSM 19370]|uniref:site-specific DNA-methyltransferase (adenine-specific) n=1 Tax=Novosphingobium nitrogenifigens DSM 19370 TaxID=983920 RepID=F1Z7T1_9SPHN|nr:site-specific DNA-methyltransferase [Novosphingobium nitrogenifigens]EGD59294.1 adenine specific DNA methylase [Novosphingobium nitrogenifigens DSM 19370]